MAKLRSLAWSDRSGSSRGIALVALLVMALGLSACNTIEGMGEDVSAAGDAMSGTASDVKDEM